MRWRPGPITLILASAALVPLVDLALPESLRISEAVRGVFLYAILALGLNVVTGYAGLLNLGIAAFMAIGAYAFAILTCEIYPFQIGFWPALMLTIPIGALAGFLLGAPTLRLRGDYLAIVTLGFGEIVQDVLKNLDTITKGTQGINPLPGPSFGGEQWTSSNELGWYYLLFALLVIVVMAVRNLERSRLGRAWFSIRQDELASRSMGIRVERVKMLAFSTAAAIAALAGGISASVLSSTGEPSNYDFQVSMLALCIIIVGGIGGIAGVLLGALVMIGLNSIVLVKATAALAAMGIGGQGNVLLSPNNWKYLIFGLALVLAVRLKPDGLLPPRIERSIR
ncbi:MAG: branched-chain amino acid ABC transporter permease [Phycisphaerales bacterium]|nr:branched-chain amino acid ABC transporter permease [Phycisphaerales bacterium]